MNTFIVFLFVTLLSTECSSKSLKCLKGKLTGVDMDFANKEFKCKSIVTEIIPCPSFIETPGDSTEDGSSEDTTLCSTAATVNSDSTAGAAPNPTSADSTTQSIEETTTSAATTVGATTSGGTTSVATTSGPTVSSTGTTSGATDEGSTVGASEGEGSTVGASEDGTTMSEAITTDAEGTTAQLPP
ncbi:hypothetical protein ACOME3_005130 [Neoechinorhynchus agilis]